MLYTAGLLLLCASAVLAACRLSPAVADFWLDNGVRVVAQALSRLSRRVPFPVAEALALLVAAVAIFLLLRSRRALCVLLSIIFAMYALFWAPLYFATPSAPVNHVAEAEALVRVSRRLADELNASAPFAMPGDLERQALEAASRANLPFAALSEPKAARYPEWMNALSIAGLYVPWTFEALYNPRSADVGVPFTAVHELMHLGGIADEGQANVAAYAACIAYGGAFGYSARLWGLKYALMSLRAFEPDAWKDLSERLSDSVRADFRAINGFALPGGAKKGRAVEVFLRLNGMTEKVDSYGALADYLCMDA